jgi:hypothetical protein
MILTQLHVKIAGHGIPRGFRTLTQRLKGEASGVGLNLDLGINWDNTECFGNVNAPDTMDPLVFRRKFQQLDNYWRGRGFHVDWHRPDGEGRHNPRTKRKHLYHHGHEPLLMVGFSFPVSSNPRSTSFLGRL